MRRPSLFDGEINGPKNVNGTTRHSRAMNFEHYIFRPVTGSLHLGDHFDTNFLRQPFVTIYHKKWCVRIVLIIDQLTSSNPPPPHHSS